MAQNYGAVFQQTGRCYLWLLGSLCLFLLCTPNLAEAQITEDQTLQPNNTVVTHNGNNSLIEGGTRRGDNLFHSFQEFSLPTGNQAFFNNAADIQNIFSRVTGGNVSQIDGLIRANDTANLFLINPNGIVLGPNAQLSIGGSFIGSTANSIKFGDGSEFRATNPQAPPLLTLNVPIGLQFGHSLTREEANPGSITVQGIGSNPPTSLQVQSGKTLALVGGQITIAGGSLKAPQGRIELGSVGNNSLVSLTPTTNGFALGYEGIENFQDIQLSQQAVIDASGAGGGEIQVQGAHVMLTAESQILADTLGNLNGGGITIQAEQLSIKEGAFVSASTFGSGASGSLTVKAASVDITGTRRLQDVLDQLFVDRTISPAEFGGGLFSLGFGSGSSNHLMIETGRLSLREGAFISTSPFGTGLGGDMVVRASESVELVGSELFTDSFGSGDAGQVTIQTGQLIAREGGGIFTSTFGAGRGGNLTVQASESIDLIGTTPDGRFKSGFGSNAFMDATQAVGNLNIQTRRLSIRDGAGIGAVTFGKAQGGLLSINASELVEVIGTSVNGRELSSLNLQSQGEGAAGDIEINTRRLVVRDGGLVTTATQEAGQAGRLVVRASESVEVIGTSADGQFSSSLRSNASFDSVPSGLIPPMPTGVLGEAGDLTIETAKLIVRDGAEVTVSGAGLGAAGNLRVTAESIQLDNGGKITAATASGAGGNITLIAQSLLMRRGSQISTNADNADGGNISIDTAVLAALENSDISANAQAGVGGRVTINASGIFGTQFREAQTPESDITATSALGPQFDGIVELNTPDIDPSQGLVELPEQLSDSSDQITISCASEAGNSFVITGRGGLPEDPTQTLRGRAVWRDLRNLTGIRSQSQESIATRPYPTHPGQPTHPSPIIEAQGWVINAAGKMELVSTPPNAISQKPWQIAASCHTVNEQLE